MHRTDMALVALALIGLALIVYSALELAHILSTVPGF